MYVPRHFKEEDQSTLKQLIRENSLGLLIVADEQGIDANHVPFYLHQESPNSEATLQCHLARANPVWQRLYDGARVLVVFQGPEAYISPSWYPTKTEHGKVVPTWNYVAVHVEGKASVFENDEWLAQHLDHLTAQHEARMPEPWKASDAPAEYTAKMRRAIVGVEIQIESILGKLKASQNQPEANKAGVRSALAASERAQDRAMSALIK